MKIMKELYIGISIIIELLSFYACKYSFTNNNQMIGIRVTQKYPIIDLYTGKINSLDSTSVEIYHLNGMILYSLEYSMDSVNLNTKKTTYSSIWHHFFVQYPDSLYGYDYDIHKTPNLRRLNADSVLKREWVTSVNLNSYLVMNKTKLISSLISSDSVFLHEYYSFINEDTSAHGTIQFWYSKSLIGSRYSLSKELDSLKMTKLYKAVIIQDPRLLHDSKIIVDQINMKYELEIIKVLPPEIRSFLKNYKLQSK